MARGSHFWSCFFVMQEENLDSVWFFKHFWALGTCRKGGICRYFSVFFVNFMSWRACGLYLRSQCFFEAPKAKMLIAYCFLSILELSARLEKVFVLDIFQFLLWNLCLGVHVACIRCVNAFSNIKTNIFILYCFLQYFWAVGTSRKGDLFRRFPDFFYHSTRKYCFCLLILQHFCAVGILWKCFFCCFCRLLIAISTSCVGELVVCRKPFFLTSLWWLAFGAPGPLASFSLCFFQRAYGD